MGGTKKAEKKLLAALQESPLPRKALKKSLKSTAPKLCDRFQKALKRLKKHGHVVKDGDVYKISGRNDLGNVVQVENVDEPVPIAMKLRKVSQSSKKRKVTFDEPKVDLEEEIRRLEQELEASSSSDESDSVASDEASVDNGVVSLSQFAEDRIAKLPETCLPEPGKYSNKEPVKKSRSSARLPKGRISHNGANDGKKDGLRLAVQEVLNGYKARSSERLPFYCRFCAKQYNDEREFEEHKRSDFHIAAVSMERKATFCRLCLKQLTSPTQMKEHLKSRPHRERLARVQSRQRNRNIHEQGSKRQWT